MQLRIVRGKVQAGRVDEFARRWQEGIGSQLKSQPGFRHGHLVANRETNTIVGVTVWETLPDQALVQGFVEQVRDVVAGPPEIEDYEVLVEV